jgi:hypothetical protein
LNSIKKFILLLLKLSGLKEGGSRAPKYGFAQGANTSNAGPASDIHYFKEIYNSFL